MYKYIIQFPTYGKIDVESSYNASTRVVEVTGTSEFALDIANGTYRMAFALAENKVGPYAQTNYYAGDASLGYLPGWTDNGSSVLTIFNEVGREIVDPFGITGSLPSNIAKGQKYSYKANVSASSVRNIDNCFVVGMILDSATGEVINSAKAYIGENSGVKDIVTESENGIFRVYNTQGISVLETEDASELNNLPKGIYIINGKKVMKP